MEGYKPSYTVSEQKIIVNYLLSLKTSGLSVTGNVIWQKMEKDVNINRSWQSLKEHFRHTIVLSLANHHIFPELTADDVKFLKGTKSDDYTPDTPNTQLYREQRALESNRNLIKDPEETFFGPVPIASQYEQASEAIQLDVKDESLVESEKTNIELSLKLNDLKLSPNVSKTPNTVIKTTTLKEHIATCLNCFRDLEGITKHINVTKCTHCETVFQLKFEEDSLRRVRRHKFATMCRRF